MRAVDHERKIKCDWPKYLRRHTIPREPSLVVFHNYLLSKYILLSLYDFVHFADSVQLQSWWKLVCSLAKFGGRGRKESFYHGKHGRTN